MSKYDNKIPDVPLEIQSDDLLTDAIVDHPVALREECFKISFEKYKENHCEFKNLDKSSYKKALKWMKEVSVYTSQEDVYRYGQGGDIKNAGNYSFLFQGLSDDADIKEFYLVGDNRIFYYIDDAKKIINCLLFKNTHIKK